VRADSAQRTSVGSEVRAALIGSRTVGRQEDCDFASQLALSAWAILAGRSPDLHSDAALKARVIAQTVAWARSLAAAPRPRLPDEFRRLIETRNWPAAYRFACIPGSKAALPAGRQPWHRITLAIEMILTIPDVAQWPRLLATLLCYADNPAREHVRLSAILGLLCPLGLRVFDSDAARGVFDRLPARITIFRGTSLARATARHYGLCWTLNREIAVMFARFQPYGRGDSVPAVLRCLVAREEIAALFVERGHDEVMVCPERLLTVDTETLNDVRITTSIEELTGEELARWQR
jgi:hypothetical protein